MSLFLKRSFAAVVMVFAVLSDPPAMQGQPLTVTTLAGLAGSSGSADGTGSAARFLSPYGVGTDGSGNVYVADTDNHTIRKITAAGAVTTLAGLAGVFGTVEGTGSVARFFFPTGVATDSSGNIYVSDADNNKVRKITPAGAVTTLAGPDSPSRLSGSADGTGSAARFNLPTAVATDSSGNVYVTDYRNRTIRKITPAGVVTTLAGLAGSAGSVDGTGSAARFSDPNGVATDSSGNIYVADSGNQTIRKITPAGVVTTLAGLAGAAGSADGTGSAARFSLPFGVATDSSGNVYVADLNNHTIRKITPAGAVTTVAGLAGNAGSADGTGSAARFFSPSGTATDSSGNVYVADRNNHTIRKISPAAVTTSLTCPAAFTAGTTANGTVTISAAQATATTITLASSDMGVATVPASVDIAAGATSATFPITGVSAGTSTITATPPAGLGTAQTCTATVTAPVTISVTPPAAFPAGTTGTATVTISAAQATDTTITLSSSNTGVATVPPNVVIAAGATSATFLITGVSPGTSTITVTPPAGLGTPQSFIVTVNPAVAAIPAVTPFGLFLLASLMALAGYFVTKSMS